MSQSSAPAVILRILPREGQSFRKTHCGLPEGKDTESNEVKGKSFLPMYTHTVIYVWCFQSTQELGLCMFFDKTSVHKHMANMLPERKAAANKHGMR